VALVLLVELESVIGPLFWLGFTGWLVLGFLTFPMQVAIPGRRRATGPFLGLRTFVFFLGGLLLLVLATGRDRSPFLPLVGVLPGLLVGVALNLAILVLPFQRTAYCSNCQVTRGLVNSHRTWYCSFCGQIVAVPSGASKYHQTAAVRARKARKPVYARKTPKESQNDVNTDHAEQLGKS